METSTERSAVNEAGGLVRGEESFMGTSEVSNPCDMEAIKNLCEEYKKYNHIPSELYESFDIKRGLRNQDGTGVLPA